MSDQSISMRTVEGAELDPPVLETLDVPVVHDGGLIINGSDYYVFDVRKGQWRAATFVVTV